MCLRQRGRSEKFIKSRLVIQNRTILRRASIVVTRCINRSRSVSRLKPILPERALHTRVWRSAYFNVKKFSLQKFLTRLDVLFWYQRLYIWLSGALPVGMTVITDCWSVACTHCFGLSHAYHYIVYHITELLQKK